jgi:CheY-like chemotaxis protein
MTETYKPADFKIIVIDDEKVVLDLMADILELNGWTVEAFNSPIDGLARMKKVKFDALTLDLYMPEMPGMLVHAKLKVVDPELALHTVFVTGHFNRQELKRDLENGAHLLLKPFEPAELLDTMSKILPTAPRSANGS